MRGWAVGGAGDAGDRWGWSARAARGPELEKQRSGLSACVTGGELGTRQEPARVRNLSGVLASQGPQAESQQGAQGLVRVPCRAQSLSLTHGGVDALVSPCAISV